MAYKGSNYTVKILTLMLKDCAGSQNGGDWWRSHLPLAAMLTHFDFIDSMWCHV